MGQARSALVQPRRIICTAMETIVRNLATAPAFVLMLMAVTPAHAQSAPATNALFAQRCQMCHSVDPAKKVGIGPNLSGVAGRKAGTLPGFNYSSALKASNIVWTPANLDKYLASPFKMVPGTRMVISVPDAKQRADLVAWLAKQKK